MCSCLETCLWTKIQGLIEKSPRVANPAQNWLYCVYKQFEDFVVKIEVLVWEPITIPPNIHPPPPPIPSAGHITSGFNLYLWFNKNRISDSQQPQVMRGGIVVGQTLVCVQCFDKPRQSWWAWRACMWHDAWEQAIHLNYNRTSTPPM